MTKNTPIESIPKPKGRTDLSPFNRIDSPVIRTKLMDRPITFITIPSIIQLIRESCEDRKQIIVASCNIHSFNLSQQYPWFYEYLSSADIVRCDGQGILKAVKFLGLDLPSQYQAAGTWLIPRMLEDFSGRDFSYFLLGSKPQNLGKAIKNLQGKYPRIRVDGHHGYFNKNDISECQEVIQKINAFNPDILIVGMGMPIQERFIYEYKKDLNVKVILPCGAVIDRLAGVVNDCPTYISSSGFEWLYRLVKEPKRLGARYLLGNPAFALQLALASTYANPLQLQ